MARLRNQLNIFFISNLHRYCYENCDLMILGGFCSGAILTWLLACSSDMERDAKALLGQDGVFSKCYFPV